MKRLMMWVAVLPWLVVGCGGNFSDRSQLVRSLRLLGVVAQPAEVALGAQVELRALAVFPGMAPEAITIAWEACTIPPIAGTGTVNPACIMEQGPPLLLPLGSGATITATVPVVLPEVLGAPDVTGGRYLPIRVRLAAAASTLDAIYRLRILSAQSPNPANQNPVLNEVLVARAQGQVPLEEGTPLPVRPGDPLVLSARFAAGSAQTYLRTGVDGTQRPVEETLNVNWYTTAGRFSSGSTGDGGPTTLRLDRDLPPGNAGVVDLWAVGRDQRGGLAFIQRQLVLQ